MNDVNKEEIFAAFNRSGKKHILITGRRGVGKTTLAEKLAGEGCCGIETYAVPKEKVVLRDRHNGGRYVIGEYSAEEGKMVPVSEGFKSGALAARSAEGFGGTVLIDEIGYLENDEYEFQCAIENLLDKRRAVITTRKEKTDFICRLWARDDVFAVDLDMIRGDVGCVIMASGHSRRFGSNKLLARFGEKTLIERAILATDGIFSRRVVVTRYKEVADICRDYGVDCILHDMPDRSDTVKLGLEKMEGIRGCAFCPADQPLLRRETVARLVNVFLSEKNKICRLASGKSVGMPVIFPSELFPHLAELKSGGGSAVIKEHPEMLFLLQTENEAELLDSDTPEELSKLEKQYL